ncbi:hypothetical protein BGZ83_002415, partial [Gryganskiella cystojenkinii]
QRSQQRSQNVDSELPQFTVFGKVTSGLDIVLKVAAGGINRSNDEVPEDSADGKPNIYFENNKCVAARV